MDMTTAVTIVGGGIAGASLASALARDGLDVTLLEASEQFPDRVRGESIMPWGVAEARELGVADVMMAAGAHVAARWLRYGETTDAPREIPVGQLVPGVPGTLNLAHPVACQALVDAAAAAGCQVHRGVDAVSVADDASGAAVRFRARGQHHTVRTGLVVGADGRGSVVRREIALDLQRAEPTAAVAGMLLEGVSGPTDHDIVVEHEHGMSLLLHQGAGRVRAYHVVPIDERARYAGTSGRRRFVADLTACASVTDRLDAARAAGPCGTFPNVQTWTALPARSHTVLIGDAAGQSDPSVGCGLSGALRDARQVRDLIRAGAREADDFAGYGIERDERMRQLRDIAALMVGASVEPGPDRRERRARFAEAMERFDPAVFPVVLAMFTGPENLPSAA